MADEEHIAMLKYGIEIWNNWYDNNLMVLADLSEADLDRADLSGINLSGANLCKASLNGANLSDANLNGANLSDANLSEAMLNSTNFTNADLTRANLSFADLSGADLSGADLSGANLNVANLTETNFSRADLHLANLNEVNPNQANWAEAKFRFTLLGDTDLSQVKGLEDVVHLGPSTIGIDTIYKSSGNIPEVFLRGAGVPDNFITFMKSLTGSAFDFYSCFISHSSKDREFVERLYADLQSNGVRCWYAPEDLKIGEPFLLGIDQGIRLHDKLLLVLSENSVSSGWVQHEVLSAMAKEQGKAPWVLFPIRLDNAVMETDVSWANMIRQSRHIGDFTHWKDHDSYKKAFDRLLRDLKAKG